MRIYYLNAAQPLLVWFNYIVHPLRTTEALLHSQNESSISKNLVQVWGSIIIVSVIVNLPVTYLFGIRIRDAEFFIVSQSVLIISGLAAAYGIHRMLRLLRQPSVFWRTVALYTIQFAYFPITAALDLPATYHLFGLLRFLKASQLPLKEAAKQLQNDPALLGDELALQLSSVSQGPKLILSTILAAMFAECASQWYEADKFRVYVAASVGIVVSAIPVISVVLPITLLNIYAHVH